MDADIVAEGRQGFELMTQLTAPPCLLPAPHTLQWEVGGWLSF